MSSDNVLGLSSSTICPELALSRQAYNLLQHYSIAAVEIGYEHVGAALLESDLYNQLIAIGRCARPPVSSLHAPYRPDRDLSASDEHKRLTALAHTENALVLARDLAVDLVVVHVSQDPIAPEQRCARLAQARKSLAVLVTGARQLGMRLAVELMPPEWLPAGLPEAQAIVEGLDPAVIGFCLDTNHANLTGDLSDIVRGLGPRMWSVHISDNDGCKQRHWMPLQGVIDWPAFMSALKAVGYCGPLIYELDPHPAGICSMLEEIVANFMCLQAFS